MVSSSNIQKHTRSHRVLSIEDLRGGDLVVAHFNCSYDVNYTSHVHFNSCFNAIFIGIKENTIGRDQLYFYFCIKNKPTLRYSYKEYISKLVLLC